MKSTNDGKLLQLILCIAEYFAILGPGLPAQAETLRRRLTRRHMQRIRALLSDACCREGART